MSHWQAPHEIVDEPNREPNTGTFLPRITLSLSFYSTSAAEIGDHQNPPQSAQNQESRGIPKRISDHVDGSGPIFSLYLDMATEEDKKMAENWKDDADGILIFVCCYVLLLNLRLR
jgi:hypothetical protein